MAADWCFNKLDIHGDKEMVDAAVAGMRGSYDDGSECLFDFGRVFPPPPNVATLRDWHYDNWGTDRYPTYCADVTDGNADFTLEFMTAWGPALGVVAALAARYPELRFFHSYDFDPLGYGGALTYEQGKLVTEEYWEDDEEDDEDDEESPPDAIVAEVEEPITRIRPGVRTRRSSLAEGGAGQPR